MNYLVLGIAVAVIGVVLGRAAVGAAGRSGTSTEHAARRRSAVVLTSLAVGAAILIFDAFRTERHRWLNVAVVAVMFSAAAFDWIRARRRTPS
jgi:xanthine/uracil permease